MRRYPGVTPDDVIASSSLYALATVAAFFPLQLCVASRIRLPGSASGDVSTYRVVVAIYLE